jgi:hypothetical protein
MKIQLLDYSVLVQLDRANVIIETILACNDTKAIPEANLTVLLETAHNCIKTAEVGIEKMGCSLD